MERRNSLLYFQWLHKGSSAFRTFLLFVYDKTLLSSHAITFCLHTFFWRVYNENLLLKCSGFTDPTLKLAFPMTSFFKCHLNNAFWDFREQVFSLEFFFRNRKLKGWGGAGVEEEVGTWGPDISVLDEAQSSMTISLGSQNSETKWEYMWQVTSSS